MQGLNLWSQVRLLEDVHCWSLFLAYNCFDGRFLLDSIRRKMHAYI